MNKKIAKRLVFAIITFFMCFELSAVIQPAFAGSGHTKDTYRFRPKTTVDKRLHKRLIAKRALKTAQLRQLADHGDRLAAYRYAILLDGLQSSRPDDVVHYYSMAASLGQVSAVGPLIGLIRLQYTQVSGARLTNAKNALLHALALGNTDAMWALSVFYRDGKPFGLQGEAGRKLLQQAADAGNVDAAFELAVLMTTPKSEVSDHVIAQHYLEIAAESGNLVAKSLMSAQENSQ